MTSQPQLMMDAAFSLTLTLSRWDWQQPAYVSAYRQIVRQSPCQLDESVGEAISLSRRERAGVRGKQPGDETHPPRLEEHEHSTVVA